MAVASAVKIEHKPCIFVVENDIVLDVTAMQIPFLDLDVFV